MSSPDLTTRRSKAALDQLANYTVTEIDLTPGERISVIKNVETGLPLFDPTVWSTSELRSAGQRPNSINQALRAVSVMQRYFDVQGINLDARLRAGMFLTQAEATGLAARCRIGLRLSGIKTGAVVAAADVKTFNARRGSKFVALAQQLSPVKDTTASVRAHYIRSFLSWKLDDYLFKTGVDDQRFRDLQSLGKEIIEAFAKKAPKAHDYGQIDARQGLTPESRSILEAVTDPVAQSNPWQDHHARVRNHVIVQVFLALGLRAGELLGLRVRDFSGATGAVKVLRRTDNAEDSRARRGEVKTRERELKLSPQLSESVRSYVLNERRSIRGARRHEFLFVASRTGAPLSYSALAKTFAQLRVAFPSQLHHVVAHILRHTWNDDFSEQADLSGMSQDREKKIRSYGMGWSEHSGMASRYTKRHTQREADAHLIAIQERSFKRRSKGNGSTDN